MILIGQSGFLEFHSRSSVTAFRTASASLSMLDNARHRDRLRRIAGRALRRRHIFRLDPDRLESRVRAGRVDDLPALRVLVVAGLRHVDTLHDVLNRHREAGRSRPPILPGEQ